MRKRIRWPKKAVTLTVTITLLTVLVGTFFTITPATANAVSSYRSQQHVSVQTHARPNCTGYLQASPPDQATNGIASITWGWGCEGPVYVTLDVDWKDGYTASYTCWANCSSGVHTMIHVYTKNGTYYALGVMGGNASGDASATIEVHRR